MLHDSALVISCLPANTDLARERGTGFSVEGVVNDFSKSCAGFDQLLRGRENGAKTSVGG